MQRQGENNHALESLVTNQVMTGVPSLGIRGELPEVAGNDRKI